MTDKTVKIIDVHLSEAHYNSVCACNIPGAWVAVCENDCLGEIAQPFARPHEYDDADAARAGAESYFN